MPSLTFIVKPFTYDQCSHLETMIIINKCVLVPSKDVNVDDELKYSIYKSSFI
jgi:hypothetical protein